MKKRFLPILPAILMAVALAGAPAWGQNLGQVKQSARTAAAGISVSTANGKTTVTYKNKVVWTGKTSGKVSGRAKAVNGAEFAAAFDGNKVIWESSPGAAKKVQ